DLIIASDGPCTVFGGAGNDGITVGSGGDSIDAGAGDDTIFGGVRNDSLGGGKGDTTIFGGDGNDLVVAGSDPDLILTDTPLTRAGEAVMKFSGIERAKLEGGPSGQLLDASASTLPTQLVGGGGDDTLLGGAGDDTLEGGQGNDLLVGGSGNDTYLFGPGALGSDTIQEAENAGADALDFSSFAGPVTIDLNRVGPQVVNPGLLILSLSGPTAIEDVQGS